MLLKTFLNISTIYANTITVSGLSAGGYMAVQTHIALSSIISGSAIIAGGPYYCARNNLYFSLGQCSDTYYGSIPIEDLVLTTKNFHLWNYIDDPNNLKDDRVFLFSGESDSVVRQSVVKSLETYYQHFLSPTQIFSDYTKDTEHCFPTLDSGEYCLVKTTPFIGKCGIDTAGDILRFFYGSNLKKGKSRQQGLVAFPQEDFSNTLSAHGYVYIPEVCRYEKCHLHISFHGCQQDYETVGMTYAELTGFNDWAEANNLIILYPYVKSTTIPYNPLACWDWWGYTGTMYPTKYGIQISFTKNLIQAFLQST